MKKLAIIGVILAFLALVSPIILGLLNNHKLEKRIKQLESLHTTPLSDIILLGQSQSYFCADNCRFANVLLFHFG